MRQEGDAPQPMRAMEAVSKKGGPGSVRHSKLEEAAHFPSTEMKPIRKGVPRGHGTVQRPGPFPPGIHRARHHCKEESLGREETFQRLSISVLKSLSYLKRVSNWDKSKTLNCFCTQLIFCFPANQSVTAQGNASKITNKNRSFSLQNQAG